jgi:hypothetical protein
MRLAGGDAARGEVMQLAGSYATGRKLCDSGEAARLAGSGARCGLGLPRCPRVRSLRLGVRPHPGVAVAALVLPAGTAGARVVAPDVGELVGHARALAVFHVRTAVDRRS